MYKKNFYKKIFFACIYIILFISVIFFLINFYVIINTNEYIFKDIKDVPKSYTAIVLGARVNSSGDLSAILHDRVTKTAELYKNKIVSRILVSGDHGQKYYDEVNAIKKYLLEIGIPGDDIFLDHAGFNTYNSIVRAKKIFCVKDMIIVTQKFHLPRAVYIARENNIDAHGCISDKKEYIYHNHYAVREFMARVKSFFEVLLNIDPEFMGEQMPITGNSKLSWDKKIVAPEH